MHGLDSQLPAHDLNEELRVFSADDGSITCEQLQNLGVSAVLVSSRRIASDRAECEFYSAAAAQALKFDRAIVRRSFSRSAVETAREFVAAFPGAKHGAILLLAGNAKSQEADSPYGAILVGGDKLEVDKIVRGWFALYDKVHDQTVTEHVSCIHEALEQRDAVDSASAELLTNALGFQVFAYCPELRSNKRIQYQFGKLINAWGKAQGLPNAKTAARTVFEPAPEDAAVVLCSSIPANKIYYHENYLNDTSYAVVGGKADVEKAVRTWHKLFDKAVSLAAGGLDESVSLDELEALMHNERLHLDACLVYSRHDVPALSGLSGGEVVAGAHSLGLPVVFLPTEADIGQHARYLGSPRLRWDAVEAVKTALRGRTPGCALYLPYTSVGLNALIFDDDPDFVRLGRACAKVRDSQFEGQLNEGDLASTIKLFARHSRHTHYKFPDGSESVSRLLEFSTSIGATVYSTDYFSLISNRFEDTMRRIFGPEMHDEMLVASTNGFGLVFIAGDTAQIERIDRFINLARDKQQLGESCTKRLLGEPKAIAESLRVLNTEVSLIAKYLHKLTGDPDVVTLRYNGERYEDHMEFRIRLKDLADKFGAALVHAAPENCRVEHNKSRWDIIKASQPAAAFAARSGSDFYVFYGDKSSVARAQREVFKAAEKADQLNGEDGALQEAICESIQLVPAGHTDSYFAAGMDELTGRNDCVVFRYAWSSDNRGKFTRELHQMAARFNATEVLMAPPSPAFTQDAGWKKIIMSTPEDMFAVRAADGFWIFYDTEAEVDHARRALYVVADKVNSLSESLSKRLLSSGQ